MDQTDVAVTGGIIVAPATATLFYRATGWSAWLTIPVGLIVGFLIATVSVYLLIGILPSSPPDCRNDDNDST